MQAQTTFTANLRKNESGKGTVMVIQSEEIEQIVNNTLPASPTKPSTSNTSTSHSTSKPASQTHDETTATETSSGKSHSDRARYKAQGYRICIYTGGNSRKDKESAYTMATKCKNIFSELATYPLFIAPRWVTHVGDFKTKEEAQKYVSLIKKAKITYETRIVSSEVNLPYE